MSVHSTLQIDANRHEVVVAQAQCISIGKQSVAHDWAEFLDKLSHHAPISYHSNGGELSLQDATAVFHKLAIAYGGSQPA